MKFELILVPSSVRNLEVAKVESDYVIITWSAPEHPFGNVTHYVIVGEIVKPELDKTKNYCSDERKYKIYSGILYYFY